MNCVLFIFFLMKLQCGHTIKYLNDVVLYTEGMKFPVEQSYLTMTVAASCECRKFCIEDKRCRNYCWTSYAEHASCRLSDFQAQNLTKVPSNNSGSGLKIPYMLNGFLGHDGLLYLPINTGMTFIEAEIMCESHGGYHIGVYKTKNQLDILNAVYKKYNKEIWVDLDSLTNSSNAYAVWADGTPFNETEIFKMNLTKLMSDEGLNPPSAKFRYNGTDFVDKIKSQGSYSALCQLDPTTL